MNTFFKELAQTLKDRQEFQLTVKKIEGDLLITIALDLKEGLSNLEMSGTPEEIDEHFLSEINKPMSVEKVFKSNAEEIKKELEDETEEPVKEEKKEPATTKKSPAKKPAAKSKAKKTEKEVADSAHEKELEEMKQDSIEEKTESPEPGEIESEQKDTPAEEVFEIIEETEKPEELEIEAGEVEAETSSEEVTDSTETKSEAAAVEETKVEEADSDDAPPSPKELFDHLMSEGDKLFGLRDYAGADASYKKALEIFPEDEKAKKSAKKAYQWVEALKNI